MEQEGREAFLIAGRVNRPRKWQKVSNDKCAYARRRGFPPEDARDLTRDFFAQLLRKNHPARTDPAKGRFRSFLLHALNQFLVDQRERPQELLGS